jgi:hypothetical protein
MLSSHAQWQDWNASMQDIETCLYKVKVLALILAKLAAGAHHEHLSLTSMLDSEEGVLSSST